MLEQRLTELDPKTAARTRVALAKLYNYSGKIMTLAEYIASHTLTRRTHTIENHAARRVNLCHPETRDRHTYTLWFECGKGESGYDVPKLVYNLFTELEDRTTDNRWYDRNGRTVFSSQA